jgi:hypothetical protein
MAILLGSERKTLAYRKALCLRCTPAEWRARIDLAACYRLVTIYGMSDMMANHISAHVSGEPGAFSINAYGMVYKEITASSLIKIDHSGRIVCTSDFDDLNYGIALVKVAVSTPEETWKNYQPSTRRPCGLMEWPAWPRKLDRMDASYKT